MEKKKNIKSFIGVVVSTKNKKTITVKVENKFRHHLYKKMVIKHKKYAAHDEQNIANLNDVVKICECKPVSKTKHFYLEKIIKKALQE